MTTTIALNFLAGYLLGWVIGLALIAVILYIQGRW